MFPAGQLTVHDFFVESKAQTGRNFNGKGVDVCCRSHFRCIFNWLKTQECFGVA